jgi:hypothetical protein
MRWPRRSARTEPADIEIEPEWGVPIVHASPGFETVMSRVEGRADLRVLDLGSSQGANIEFLGRRAAHIRIVDLLGDSGPAPDASDGRLSFPESWGGYDLILAWDVFNYLEPDAVRTLVGSLERSCSPGSAIFLIIVTSEQMSARPLVYNIEDDATLKYRAVTPDRLPGAGLNAAAMERFLSGFVVERSVVLRHGVLEIVAVKPGPDI